MTMRMQTPIPARVIQTLQDYLPAELDLIDGEEGDFTTPDIPNANYFDWDRRSPPAFPAFTMRLPLFDSIGVRPDTFGQRLDAGYLVECMAHVTLGASSPNPRRLQYLCYRYAAGLFRVLCVKYEGLQTIADPTRWGSPTVTTTVEPGGRVTLSPEPEQESGEVVRTVTVPIIVRRIEARA